jgi:hypothetical protein
LCALTILALVLGVTLRILSGGLSAVRVAEDYGRAVAMAESRLSTLMVSEGPTLGVRTGENSGLLWTDTVAETADGMYGAAATEGFTALRVIVRVEAGDGHAVSLQSVRLVRKR